MEPPPSGRRTGAPASRTAFEGTEWRLAECAGPDGELAPVPEEVLATAVFGEGFVAGTTGCNRYRAQVALEGAAITVGPIAMTMMACDPPRMALERAFMAALEEASARALAGAMLEIVDREGRVCLRFRAVPVARLAGTRWVAVMINNGRGAVTSVVEGVDVTAAFGEDGRVTGSGGCNTYGGPYTVDGESLAVGPLAATMRACLEPEGVAEQEAAYFGALGRVASWSVREDRLRLRSADGALEVELRPAGD